MSQRPLAQPSSSSLRTFLRPPLALCSRRALQPAPQGPLLPGATPALAPVLAPASPSRWMSPLASCRSCWSRPGPEPRGSRLPPTLTSWPMSAAAEPEGGGLSDGPTWTGPPGGQRQSWRILLLGTGHADTAIWGHRRVVSVSVCLTESQCVQMPGRCHVGWLPSGLLPCLRASGTYHVSEQLGRYHGRSPPSGSLVCVCAPRSQHLDITTYGHSQEPQCRSLSLHLRPVHPRPVRQVCPAA